MKIEVAGIEKYFDEIYTVDDTKEHLVEIILKKCPSDEQVWLINDKIEETKKIIQRFPRIQPLLKVSPIFSNEEYQKSSMPFFSTLNQIKEYAEQRV